MHDVKKNEEHHTENIQLIADNFQNLGALYSTTLGLIFS